MSELVKSENGKLYKDRRGRQIVESVVRYEGRVNTTCLAPKNGNFLPDTPRLFWRIRVYPEFEPLSSAEIKQFLGLYLCHGLCSSPKVKMKFKAQHQDLVNGSNFCDQLFGEIIRETEHALQSLIACRDPLLPIP
jgi:hypothetical protein